jgi:hypothetical protein
LKTNDEGELVSSNPGVKWSEGSREFNLKYPFNTKPIKVHAPGSGYVILPIRSVGPEPVKTIEEDEDEDEWTAYLDGSTPEARTTVNYADETLSLGDEPLKILYNPTNGETDIVFEASAVLSDGTARRKLPPIAQRVLASNAAGLVRSASSVEKAIITGKHIIPHRLQEQTVKMGIEYLNEILTCEDLRHRDRSAPVSISLGDVGLSTVITESNVYDGARDELDRAQQENTANRLCGRPGRDKDLKSTQSNVLAKVAGKVIDYLDSNFPSQMTTARRSVFARSAVKSVLQKASWVFRRDNKPGTSYEPKVRFTHWDCSRLGSLADVPYGSDWPTEDAREVDKDDPDQTHLQITIGHDVTMPSDDDGSIALKTFDERTGIDTFFAFDPKDGPESKYLGAELPRDSIDKPISWE